MDHAVAFPTALKGAVRTAVVRKLLREDLLREASASRGQPVWRMKVKRRLSLIVTPAGLSIARIHLQTTGIAPCEQCLAGRVAEHGLGVTSTAKKFRILKLLRRPEGATIADLMAETGWRAHSLRGFLAGTVRGRLGLDLRSTVQDGSRVYHVADL
ncbi:MAG: DUF3489 domain-containing protein [Variibacter sp.]